jgi:hypothetical protein
VTDPVRVPVAGSKVSSEPGPEVDGMPRNAPTSTAVEMIGGGFFSELGLRVEI